MTLTIRDAESSFSYGMASWSEFIQEFEAKWYAPIAIDLIRQIAMQAEQAGMMGIMPPDQAIQMSKIRDKLRGL